MKLQTIAYPAYERQLPSAGQHILAQYDDDNIVVYQAYPSAIADFAVAHQCLGGPAFSFTRMSWIKPNFLWMMFRCGWASKENQERVLALWLRRTDFEAILSQAVYSSFRADKYTDEQNWKQAVEKSEVRLQWDPDHDPFGEKLTRRAIQLGLRGSALTKFGKQSLQLVEDITPFVQAQRKHILDKKLHLLEVPAEKVYQPVEQGIRTKLDLD